MNNVTRVLVIIAATAVLGVGVWWALANRSQPTNANTNAGPTNADVVVPAGWSTYSSATYRFSIAHPGELTVEANQISDAVMRQRADGLLADVGFYMAGVQGPLYLVRVYSQPLAELLANTNDVGSLTGATKEIEAVSFRTLSGSVRRYGVEGLDYTYVVDVQNYSGESDLTAFDRMLLTFRLH